MTVARRRTRYNVRRRHFLRDLRLISLAVIIAVLACAGIYSLASAPPLPAQQEQTHLAATVTAEQALITPVDSQVIAPTVLGQGVEGTPAAIAGLGPGVTPQPFGTPSPSPSSTSSTPYTYYTQPGDSLKTVALHFGVNPAEIISNGVPANGLIDPEQILIIPRRLGDISSSIRIIPDSEIVFSPSAVGFDIEDYIENAGGYLSQYSEFLGSTGMTTGAQVIERVATEFSVNPRLLLALLEYQSHWVTGAYSTLDFADKYYPMGLTDITCQVQTECLYKQMSEFVSRLSQGYYGWRDGSVVSVTFPDKTILRLAPDLNAGSASIMAAFASLYNLQEWAGVLNPENPASFPALYKSMFGDPWIRANDIEPLFPATLTQPELVLPFDPGVPWSFSGGPHAAFGVAGAWAALDFAPASTVNGCPNTSNAWVDASATGVVVRAGYNQVVIDLDGDGYEQTGWTILYMHIAPEGMVAQGTHVDVGDHLGHPSCDGGTATGVNVHVARKYNGEWILADSAIPFVMSGWTAHAGDVMYAGTLTKGDDVVTAAPNGSPETVIERPKQ